ncbi:MAG: epoxyqueuosine reductase [Planctomycetota bacterium]|nr:epoxyqueuosine reductase [Planctomycetota bacterium]
MRTQIIAKAQELQLDVGIVHAEVMDGYMEKVRERIKRVPSSKAGYAFIRPLGETAPGTKSVIVVASQISHYTLPEGSDTHIGKNYLIDYRVGESVESKTRRQFGGFLESLRLKVSTNVMGYRWAAQAAGLGIIRRNNFFCGEQGTYYNLMAWAVDAELEEYIHKRDIPPCPTNCDRCVKACPTGTLSAAYTMNISECVSRLTTSAGSALGPDDPRNAKIGKWIYGCDACTDCCPHNAKKWQGGVDYPGLAEITQHLEPLAILRLSYEDIATILMPRFFYLQINDLWKWKVNALNVLANTWSDKYADAVRASLSDSDERVRAKAEWVLNAHGAGK